MWTSPEKIWKKFGDFISPDFRFARSWHRAKHTTLAFLIIYFMGISDFFFALKIQSNFIRLFQKSGFTNAITIYFLINIFSPRKLLAFAVVFKSIPVPVLPLILMATERKPHIQIDRVLWYSERSGSGRWVIIVTYYYYFFINIWVRVCCAA